MLTKYGRRFLRLVGSNRSYIINRPSLPLSATKKVCSKNVLEYSLSSTTVMQLRLSSGINVGIVDYAIIKNLPQQPESVLIDVREPEELKETGQIPTSINIPLGIVSQELALDDKAFKAKYGRKKPTTDTEVIFHCKIGRRSQAAAEAAVALGFKDVKNYVGSWLDWAEREGLPK